MSRAGAISDIIAQYARHGWKMRRVIISTELRSTTDVADIFGDVPVTEGEMDAIWFSRAARPGHETWELRSLADTPFALLEVIGSDIDETETEHILGQTEAKMRRVLVTQRKPN